MRNKSINAGYAVNSIVDAFNHCIDVPLSTSGANTYQLEYYNNTAPFFDDFWKDFTFPKYDYVFCTKENHPKVDMGIDKEGSTIIKISSPGFSKKDITIERNDMSLFISGKKDKEKSEKFKDVKWATKEIAERSWSLEVQGNEKWNWESIKNNISFENGILCIKVSLKEEAKPKKETYEIK